MRSGELPRSEWGRLVGTPIAEALPAFPPETRLVIVEDGGAIVGTWAFMPYIHAECVWTAEPYRRDGRVARRLLSEMRAAGRAFGVRAMLTAALTDEVRDYIVRLGGQLLPGDHYVFPVERS